MKIQDVLKQKPAGAETVAASASLREAIRRFSGSKLRALVVTEAERMVGILAIRDVLMRIDRHGAAALDEAVRESMTRDVHTVSPTSTLEEAHGAFVERGINHLPVLADGELVGLVTPADVLSRNVQGLEHQQELLFAYIEGRVL